MHFSTFMKFMTLDTGDKIRQLESYSKPGGFDFYRSSRDAVLQYCAHGRQHNAIISDIRASAPSNACQHNVEIFEHAARWLNKQTGKPFAPARGVWPSLNKHFSVHIEPEIGLQKGGKSQIVAVYPRAQSRLTRDTAGAGIILLRRAYRGTGSEEFSILDAHAGKLFSAPTNVSEAILDREIHTMESELSRILS